MNIYINFILLSVYYFFIFWVMTSSKFDNFINQYELSKTLRFELKPSKVTFKKIKEEWLFNNITFKSQIFSQKFNDISFQAEKKENNYLFSIDEVKLKELVEKCNSKMESIKKIKLFIDNNPDEIWKIWIDNEKIKIIDKDLRYILKEKNNWKKSFWNKEKMNKKTGEKWLMSNFTIKWKKWLFLTFDDIDAYFEEIRSTKSKKPSAWVFTNMFNEKIESLLGQYEIRRYQLLLNTSWNIKKNEDKLFQTKRERVSRVRSFLWIFLKLERVVSVLNFNYKDNFSEFPKELKEIVTSFNENISSLINNINLIFSESNLYLHKNIERKFTFNIRAINPNPENIKSSKVKTENEILKEIEDLEKKISTLKNKKAEIKWERKVKSNTWDTNWKNYKKEEWDSILKKINPNWKESLFSNISELRRDLEEVHQTHFAILIERKWMFYLAMENKRINNWKEWEIKKLNEFELNKYIKENNNWNSKFMNYKVITFQWLRRLCLEDLSSMKSVNFLNIKNEKWKDNKTKQNKNWREERYFDDLKAYLKSILEKNATKIGVLFTEDDFKDWETIEWDENLENLESIINKQWYKVSWEKFNLKKIEESWNIELFQIYNKDFLIDENFVNSPSDKEKFERIEYKKTQLEKEWQEFIPKYKDENKKHKRNLFTVYWQDFFSDATKCKIRIKQEWRFYIRLAWEQEWERKVSNNLLIKNKKRYSEDKVLVDFNLSINPNATSVSKKCKKNKEFQKKYIENFNLAVKNLKPKYYIGLDQWVNSLVSYCVMDENKDIVINKENWKPEIWDLSLVISNWENQGSFVEVKETLIFWSDKWVWNDEKSILEQTEANNRVLKNDENIKVFDYAEAIYSESYKRRKEIEEFSKTQIEFDEVSNLKKGYSSFVLHKIEQLAKKYSPAIISLEYLQDQKNKSRFINKDWGWKKIEDQIKDPKMYRFWASTIECIEDALLRKFQFWYGKTENWKKQLVPFFSNKEEKYKKGIQLWNIVFIDEKDTSVLCPSCNSLLIRCKNPKDKDEWKKPKINTDSDVENIYWNFRKISDIVRHNTDDDCKWNSSIKNKEFNEIKSWDDLATYNIAKKWLEFMSS